MLMGKIPAFRSGDIKPKVHKHPIRHIQCDKQFIDGYINYRSKVEVNKLKLILL